MKKILNITISVLLIIAMIVPAAIFASAEVNVSTTPSKQGGEPYEYYNLKDGLYTKKTVSGPLDNGNYQVTLESYTSDVRLIQSDNQQILDIMCLVDQSNSMLFNNRMSQLKSSLKTVMSSLINDYGAGSKLKMNVSIWSFGNVCTKALSKMMDYRELNSANYKARTSIFQEKKIEDIINDLKAHGIAGTNTGEAMTRMNEVISDRINSTKNDSIPHSQMLLVFTDGAPSVATQGFDEAIASDYANTALMQAKLLKDKDVSIYSIGVGEEFSPLDDGQNQKTLTDIVNHNGWNNDLKRATLFLNMLSSGWKAQTYCPDCENKIINNKCENKKCKNYNTEIPRDSQIIKSYNWRNDNSWKNARNDYVININPKNPDSYYYIGGASDAGNLSKYISTSILYSMSSRWVSQGSLLGDYFLKDTTSDYFGVIKGTTKIYKVPYDYSNGAYDGDGSGNNQYGESKRAWGTPVDVTSQISYVETESAVEVLATPENSQVVDVCIVDDLVKAQAEHSGNKLRITFEIRPKDSFMGGSDVPTNIYKESGIFDKDGKAVQNFANLSTTGALDTSSVPKLQVELVDASVHIDDDNVKIGYLYNLDDLGQKNLTLTYKGRYSNNEYTVKLKDSEYAVYDATGAEVKYSESKAADENSKSVDTKPNDYAEIIIGENHIDETLNNKGIVTNSKLIQFNSTGITQTDGEYSMQTPKVNKYVYLLWKGMKTSSTYLNERFPEYNKTGKDSKATTLDGIVNGIRYFSGREAIRQLDTQFNVNVFVPTIKVSDAISGGNSEYPYDSATVSDAFDEHSSQNKDAVNVYKNNEILTSLVFAQIDTSAGEFVHLIPNGSTVTVDSTQHSGFLSDTFSTSSASSISAYVKAFADKDGNIKTANSVISDKDQIKLTLSYNELADKTDLFPADAPFKFTVDEFWATNECSVCKDNEKYIPQFLGYQEQVHILDRTSSITVNKTGCDANHANESFVFSILAFKSKSDNSGADLSTMKVLNNFTIQGNGQRTITVDNQYDYYCVVEDLNSLNDVTSGWTWDYSGVSVNGINWDTIENNLFKLESKQIKVLTFNNQYDNNNNNLHYASAYASNIMSHDKIEVITSPTQQSTN